MKASWRELKIAYSQMLANTKAFTMLVKDELQNYPLFLLPTDTVVPKYKFPLTSESAQKCLCTLQLSKNTVKQTKKASVPRLDNLLKLNKGLYCLIKHIRCVAGSRGNQFSVNC